MNLNRRLAPFSDSDLGSRKNPDEDSISFENSWPENCSSVNAVASPQVLMYHEVPAAPGNGQFLSALVTQLLPSKYTVKKNAIACAALLLPIVVEFEAFTCSPLTLQRLTTERQFRGLKLESGVAYSNNCYAFIA